MDYGVAICLDIIVKTAAPRQISIFVRSPAALPWNSLSIPIIAPKTTAKTILYKSSGQTIRLPFYQRLIDLHTEMPAGLLDMPQDFIAGFQGRDRNRFSIRIHQPNRLSIL